MQRTLSYIRSMYHFEPLTQLALHRYELDMEGRPQYTDHQSAGDVDFVVDLMDVYLGNETFEQERFRRYSIHVILEYLERTHALYESSLIPKIEQAIHGVKRLFPEHRIADVLNNFFEHYRNELFEHIELEESRLFPYARRLAHGGSPRDYSVNDFKEVHTHEIEDSLDKVVNLIETDYPEVSRSFAYRAFKTLLTQFRTDLEIHHLIEEEVFLGMLEEMENASDRLPYQ